MSKGATTHFAFKPICVEGAADPHPAIRRLRSRALSGARSVAAGASLRHESRVTLVPYMSWLRPDLGPLPPPELCRSPPARPPLGGRSRRGPSPAPLVDVIALRRGLLAAYVVGLGCSITLSEGTLLLLTLLWLWRLLDSDVRGVQVWPLWAPVLAFAAATLLSAFWSGEVTQSLAASKGLLLMAALYVTADALESTGETDRFLSWLALAGGAAAVAGILQAVACPS